jgi:hypothetical protein
VGVTQDEKIFYSSAHYDIDVKLKFIFLISFAFTSRLTSHLAICLIFRCLAGSGDSTQLSAVSLALLFVQRSEKRQLNATDTLEEDHVPVNTSACANIAQSLRLPRPLSRESDKTFLCAHIFRLTVPSPLQNFSDRLFASSIFVRSTNTQRIMQRFRVRIQVSSGL